MGKPIIVTGIPGTGKSTVCNIAKRLASDTGSKISVINYGTATMEILQQHGQNMERDAMRKADLDFQCEMQKKVAEMLSEKISKIDGTTIVDTHMAIKTPYGYLPGLPRHVLQLLKPRMLVLIEAKPSEITSRRLKDATRQRGTSIEEAVKEELMFSRLMAGACAVLAGIPVKIVINAQGKQEEAAREILKMVEGV